MRYKLLKPCFSIPAGTVVFASTGHDYGLCADDEAVTGLKHVMISPSGDTPAYTCPVRDLEELPVQYPSNSWIKDKCKIGMGAQTCRYLTMAASGWSCEKGGELRSILDKRVADNVMVAQGNNCPGLDSR